MSTNKNDQTDPRPENADAAELDDAQLENVAGGAGTEWSGEEWSEGEWEGGASRSPW